MHEFDGDDLRELGEALFGDNWSGSMARRLGVSPQYIRMLAKGQREMPPAFGLQLEYLLHQRLKVLDRWHSRLMDHGFGTRRTSVTAELKPSVVRRFNLQRC